MNELTKKEKSFVDAAIVYYVANQVEKDTEIVEEVIELQDIVINKLEL